MDKKNLEGGLDNLKGKIKETGGVVTGDRVLERGAHRPTEHFGVSARGRVVELHHPTLGGDPVLVRQELHRRLDQVSHGNLLALEVVAVLEEPLDGEEVVDQPAHAPQGSQG